MVERFVALYNARDLPGLLALLNEGAAIELYGSHRELGRAGWQRERGWFYYNFHRFDGTPSAAHLRMATFEDEPVLLVLDEFGDGETVMTSVMRIEEADGRVERLRVYAMCPDVVSEVGEALGEKLWGRNRYRFDRADFR